MNEQTGKLIGVEDIDQGTADLLTGIGEGCHNGNENKGG